jgi:hypothetical protein
VAFRKFIFVIKIYRGDRRCGSRQDILLHRCGSDGTVMFDDPYFFFAFGNFQFRNTGFLNEVDEFLEFTQIHG